MADNNELRFRLDTFELYNLARAFRKKIYRVVRELPAAERYCLNPQMRRAAISVSSNVAEGHGRWHYRENIQFCRTSRGSVEEVIDDLNTCIDESYVDEAIVTQLKNEAYALISRINGYIAYLRKMSAGRRMNLAPSERVAHPSPLTPHHVGRCRSSTCLRVHRRWARGILSPAGGDERRLRTLLVAAQRRAGASAILDGRCSDLRDHGPSGHERQSRLGAHDAALVRRRSAVCSAARPALWFIASARRSCW